MDLLGGQMSERTFGGYPESCLRKGWFQLEGEQVIAIVTDLLNALEAAEREINARKGDPVTRLHNICRGLEEPETESTARGDGQCPHRPKCGCGYFCTAREALDPPQPGFCSGRDSLYDGCKVCGALVYNPCEPHRERDAQP